MTLANANYTAAREAYDAAVLEDDPILYWKCADGSGTTVSDASGNGVAGELVGNASFTAPGSPAIYRMPGSGLGVDMNRTGTRDGYIRLATVPGTWPTTAATFEMWYADTTYAPTPDGAGILSYCTSSANTGNDWMLWYDVQTEFQLHVNESTTTDGFEAGGVSPFASSRAPKYLAITWDGVAGTAKLYINGELVCTKTKAQYQATLTGGGCFVVGQDQDSVDGGYTAAQAFAAWVSNIAVYNTVLSAARIKAHWDTYADVTAYPTSDLAISGASETVVDSVAPVVTKNNFVSTDPGKTSMVSVNVVENDLDALETTIWVTYPARSELVYGNGASAANFTVSVTTDGGIRSYNITPLGSGWDDDFTLVVTARDTDNVVVEELEYELDVDAEVYPPHMDPYD